MSSEKNKPIKSRLHSRNRNREQYDLSALINVSPELKNYIMLNKYGNESVDFSKPRAVKLLNQAILQYYYGIEQWEFPDENLCPPIPGRADYIHHIADLLAETNSDNIPRGSTVTCLDVGVGASCIYPIIGVSEYDWNFIGSDIDTKSIASAQQIVDTNPSLSNKVICRLQQDSTSFFRNILDEEDKIELTICNPPFHATPEEAEKGSFRKAKNLRGKKVKKPILNFAGIQTELICEGGEHGFVHNMIHESANFAQNCYWFTTLVSKQSNLKGIYKTLDEVEAKQVKTIPMGTGNKSSRIVAWTFLTKKEQTAWRESRWKALT